MSNREDVYKEEMFYSNGHPAFCPLTNSQCKRSCSFIIYSKAAGYWQCAFGNGRLLYTKNMIKFPYSDEEIRKIKERWSN